MEQTISDKHALGTGKEIVWETWDQQKFFARVWKPAGPPRAVILAVHGLSGAAQDFGPLGARMLERGWAVYAPELRGQGRDPLTARRGDLKRLTDWYQDLQSFFLLVERQCPGIPWFLVGESMGAVVAIYWLQWLRDSLLRSAPSPAAARPPQGLILFSPVVMVEHKITLWQELLFNGLSRVLPTKRVKLGDFAPKDEHDLRVTRDEMYQEYIYTSPHHLDSYSLRFVRHLGRLIRGCAQVELPPDLPLLLPYARNDVFIQPRLIDKYFEGLVVRDKVKLLYRESYHCLLHDLDASLVLTDVEQWLERHLGP